MAHSVLCLKGGMSRRSDTRRWATFACAGLLCLGGGWFGCGLVPQTLPPRPDDAVGTGSGGSNPTEGAAGSSSGSATTPAGGSSGGQFYVPGDASVAELTSGDGGDGSPTNTASDASPLLGVDAATTGDASTENPDAESSTPDAGAAASVEGGCEGHAVDSGEACPDVTDAAPADTGLPDCTTD